MEIREQKLAAGARVTSMAFAGPDRILLGCAGGRLKSFDTASGALQGEVTVEQGEASASAYYESAFSADGRLFGTGARNRNIQVYETATGKRVISISAPARPSTLAFAPAGDVFAAGLEDATVRTWSVSTGALLRTMPTGIGGTPVLAFSPDGRLLTATNEDTDVRVFQVKEGELRRRVDQFPLTMFAAAYSPDGSMLAVAGADRNIYLWDVPRLQLTRQLTGHPEVVAAVAFSPDGKRLLSAGFDETGFRKASHVRLWDIATGQAVWTGEAPSGVPVVGFSPDGKFASIPLQGSPSVWTILG